MPPHQPSWQGPAAEARTERQLTLLAALAEAAAELALAIQRRTLDRLAAPPEPPAPRDAIPDPRPQLPPAPPPPDPAGPDPCLTFARLSRIATRALALEAALAEARRTRDARDAATSRRAVSPAEAGRRARVRHTLQQSLDQALAATPAPTTTPEALRARIAARLQDADVAAALAHRPAAELYAILGAELGLDPDDHLFFPPPTPTPTPTPLPNLHPP